VFATRDHDVDEYEAPETAVDLVTGGPKEVFDP